jgi:hypothetical protein
MRLTTFLALACLLVVPKSGIAAMNRTFMVPAYDACPTSNCIPPTRSSPYTFDSIVLYSSSKPFTAPDKVALVVVVKGLKDASGNLATTTLEFSTGTSRVTIVGSVGTLADDSPLVPQATYSIAVTKGSAHFRYATPSNTPDHGLVVNTLTAPVLYDPDGKPLATTGTETKP